MERKGPPVFGFLRISNEPIWLKMQVYEPEILLVFDDTLLKMPETFDGLQDGSTVIINTTKSLSELTIPKEAKTVALVDATGISMDTFLKNIPNTAMLGAFQKATGLTDWEILQRRIADAFGETNVIAAGRMQFPKTMMYYCLSMYVMTGFIFRT